MTAYFDDKANEIRDLINQGLTPLDDRVRSWTRALVLDIATACEFDRSGPMAFPEDLRDLAYKAILRRDSSSWPEGVPGFGVDYEFDSEGMRLLTELVQDLHTIFHEAAHRGWPGRDNPRSAVQAMDCRMEERCVELIASDPSLTLPPLPPLPQEPPMSLDDRVPMAPPENVSSKEPCSPEIRERSKQLFAQIGRGSWVVYDYYTLMDQRSNPRKAAILEVFVDEDGRLVLETVSTIVTLPPRENDAQEVVQILNPDGSVLWRAS